MKKYIYLLRIMLLAVIITLIGQSYSYAEAEKIGFVSEVTGAVFVTKIAAQSMTQAQPNSPVNVGDKFKTEKGAKLKLSFNDGSMLKVLESSEITIDENVYTPESRKSVFSVLLGKIKMAVSKIGSKDTYEIKTKTAVIGLKGTEVWLAVYKLNPEGGNAEVFETKVAFHEGYGLVRNILQNVEEAISLVENNQTIVTGEKAPTEPTAIDEEIMQEFSEPFETLRLPLEEEEKSEEGDTVEEEGIELEDLMNNNPGDAGDDVIEDEDVETDTSLPEPPPLPEEE